MRLSGLRLPVSAAALALLVFAATAKDKKPKTAPKDPQDEIAVVGHLPLSGGPVRRFLVTPHYSSFYLYAEHDGGKGITLIDVTKAAQPIVLGAVDYASSGGAGSLFAVAGTAALVDDGPVSPGGQTLPSRTIRVMDFSDAMHPKVAREFTGVTAVTQDDRRGLIFLANPEGIWILHQSLALDPEVRKAWEREVNAR